MIQTDLVEKLNLAEQALLNKAGWHRSKEPNLVGNYRWSEDGKHWYSQNHAAGLVRLCKLFESPTPEIKELLEAEKQLLVSRGWKLVKEHSSAQGMDEWQDPMQDTVLIQMAAIDQIRNDLWDALWDEALQDPEIKKNLGFTDLLP